MKNNSKNSKTGSIQILDVINFFLKNLKSIILITAVGTIIGFYYTYNMKKIETYTGLMNIELSTQPYIEGSGTTQNPVLKFRNYNLAFKKNLLLTKPFYDDDFLKLCSGKNNEIIPFEIIASFTKPIHSHAAILRTGFGRFSNIAYNKLTVKISDIASMEVQYKSLSKKLVKECLEALYKKIKKAEDLILDKDIEIIKTSLKFSDMYFWLEAEVNLLPEENFNKLYIKDPEFLKFQCKRISSEELKKMYEKYGEGDVLSEENLLFMNNKAFAEKMIICDQNYLTTNMRLVKNIKEKQKMSLEKEEAINELLIKTKKQASTYMLNKISIKKDVIPDLKANTLYALFISFLLSIIFVTLYQVFIIFKKNKIKFFK